MNWLHHLTLVLFSMIFDPLHQMNNIWIKTSSAKWLRILFVEYGFKWDKVNLRLIRLKFVLSSQFAAAIHLDQVMTLEPFCRFLVLDDWVLLLEIAFLIFLILLEKSLLKSWQHWNCRNFFLSLLLYHQWNANSYIMFCVPPPLII